MSVSPVRNASVDGSSNTNTYVIGAWEVALAEAEAAKKAGITLERPADDHRTAQEIIDGSPLLKNLGNQGNDDADGDGNPDGVKDMLRQRVGDFEHDADAAYRAVQILEHVEKFDENGNP